MISQASTLLLFLFLSTISALAFGGPALATAGIASTDLADIKIPLPTPAPSNDELRRRQEAQRTVLAGPDATCGYLGGNSSQPWGCTASSTCAFATPTVAIGNSTQTAAPGSVVCCGPSGCPTAPGPTSCVDKGRFDVKTACTGSCLEDEQVLKCTSGIYLYCNTIAFASPSVSAFFCNYISTYDAIPAETAFSGQAGRLFTPTVQALPASTTSSPPSTITSSTGDSTASTTQPTNSTIAAAGSDGAGGNKSNKGAIIGGTIGGVAGLALIVAAFFLWRKRNMKEPAPVLGEDYVVVNDKRGATPATSSQEAVVAPVKTESRVQANHAGSS